MCDYLCCECCWCSVACTGLGVGLLCCGCWVCRPHALETINPNCCSCWESSGCGASLICAACMIFTPNWLRTYHIIRNAPPSALQGSTESHSSGPIYPIIYQWKCFFMDILSLSNSIISSYLWYSFNLTTKQQLGSNFTKSDNSRKAID